MRQVYQWLFRELRYRELLQVRDEAALVSAVLPWDHPFLPFTGRRSSLALETAMK